MPRPTIEQMVADAYDDKELASAIIADIKRLGTAEAILSGEMTLPHPQDARRWYEQSKRELAARK